MEEGQLAGKVREEAQGAPGDTKQLSEVRVDSVRMF